MPDSQPDAARATGSDGAARQCIGDYELLRLLGEGGMGKVWLAHQKSLDRQVALKVLSPHVARDTQFTERFQQEARVVGRINHPHVVQGIDVGRDEASGLWYFAMEYVEGRSVKELLDDLRVLPEDRALNIAEQVADALACAEKNGIVHRDVKPDNILITTGGIAKLADLGLAKTGGGDAKKTQSGVALGTPNYISPEQAKGKENVDIRSDIYSLGASLFHMVTGQYLFYDPSPAEIMVKQAYETPRLARTVNPAVSEGTSRLIDRMLAKDADLRPRSPAELQGLIQQVRKALPQSQGGEGQGMPQTPMGTTPVGPGMPIPKRSSTRMSVVSTRRSAVTGRTTGIHRRREGFPLLMVVVILAFAGLCVAAMLSLGDKRPPARRKAPATQGAPNGGGMLLRKSIDDPENGESSSDTNKPPTKKKKPDAKEPIEKDVDAEKPSADASKPVPEKEEPVPEHAAPVDLP